MNEAMATEDKDPVAEAVSETQALLALLTERQPDADELKDRWYSLGLAVRAAVRELRQAETQGESRL
jgi:hypothetical protein